MKPRTAPRSFHDQLRCLWIGLATLCVAAVPACSSAEDRSWDRLADGLSVAIWNPGSDCATQVPPLLLVRVDPDQYRFETYHFRDEGLPAPLTIHAWRQRTQASILFNAGLFAEDYSYLGLLMKGGRSLGSRLHPGWKGLFVAEPTEPGRRNARVMDLAKEPFTPEAPAYREAAQSLMLLEEGGKPRVKHSGKRAHQTVVGEDEAGNILLIKTAGEVPMWELAVCLRDGMPSLRHAMAMDGGLSSDLLFDDSLLSPPAQAAPPPPWRALVDGSAPLHIPLPAVIGIRPRELTAAQQR